MSMCGMPPCRHCGKPVQTVWGTAEWHAGHDPVGGYCQCVLNEFRQLAEAAKAKLESDKFQEMREACETYLRPKGNMQSREDYVVKSFERRSEYDRVCSPDAVLSTLNELDRLRAEVASLKEERDELIHMHSNDGHCIVDLTQQLAAAQEQISVLTVHGQRLRDALATAYEKLKIVCGGMREYQGGMPTQALFPLLESALSALPQQVKSEDARMLEFVYSENYTSSNALVEIELRMLNGDFPTMEEVRKAIRAAISAQENKS